MIEHMGHVESEAFLPCACGCGRLLEVGRKKEGVWYHDFPGAPSRVYRRECLKKLVNLHD